MIQTGLQFLAAEALICFLVSALYKRFADKKFFKIMPAVIMVLIINVLCDTVGVWSHTENETIGTTISTTMGYLVPFMVYVVCIQANFKKMLKMGPKLILTFLVGSVSVCLGMVISALALHNLLGIDQVAGTYGAWSGAFSGGIENLYAVANSVGLSDTNMANTLVLINLVYSPWVMLMVVLKALAPKYDKWVKTDLAAIEAISQKVDKGDKKAKTFNQYEFFRFLAVGVVVIAFAATVSGPLNSLFSFIPKAVYQYLIITIIAALLGTFTDLGDTIGCPEVGGILATFVIGISVANIDLKAFTNIGWFFVAGVIVLVIHGLIMIIYGKISKTDLCTLGCASIANIGAVSSATVVSASYSKSHQSIAVLMAALGSIVGTFFGLGVYAILHGMVG